MKLLDMHYQLRLSFTAKLFTCTTSWGCHSQPSYSHARIVLIIIIVHICIIRAFND